MTRALAWAARSPVFANLLMAFLLIAGGFAAVNMVRELFPEFTFDKVTVSVVYPGAAPADIERSITIKVEEAVRTLEGVRKVESVSREGVGTVTVEVDAGIVDPRDALVDIRNEVSRITTFPDDAEEPTIKLLLNRRQIASLVLSGALTEGTRTDLARELEEELLLLRPVSEVSVTGLRDREITVLVREADLQRYGLSFDGVVRAIRGRSLDLPLGTIRSSEEEQLLRVEQLREEGRELADIPVLTRADGTRVLLHEVATLRDGFDEAPQVVRLDGVPAVLFSVMRGSGEDVVAAAAEVSAWLARKQEDLPAGVELSIWKDDSFPVVDRLSLLAKNGAQGLVLVFATLVLFLGLRLSFWVAFGLPVAFLTSMLLLGAVGGSLNMISSFALIMVLGILVDDSIVVAENIARHMREDGYTVDAAVAGLLEVAGPVTASVTTTIVAFLPLFFIGGTIGKFIALMPVAVIACLIASLIECLLILPAHLAHGKDPGRRVTTLERFRAALDRGVDRFIEERYGRLIDWLLTRRYEAAAVATAGLILTVGLVASGRPAFVFFPRLDAEYLVAKVELPAGVAIGSTLEAIGRLERAVVDVGAELPLADDGEPIIRGMLTQAGQGGAGSGSVQIRLAGSHERDFSGLEVMRRWKDAAGGFPEARSMTIASASGHGPGGRPLEIRILAPSSTVAGETAATLRGELATYPGVFSVEDNLAPGKRELRVDLEPEAEALGVELSSVAQQLYAGVSGQVVQKLQRGRDEVDVRVRYDAAQRERPEQLAAMRVRSEAGLLPLGHVASIERGRTLDRIERLGGRRVVTIFGDVDATVTNANNVVSSLQETAIADLEARYPRLEVEFGGAQEEQRETVRSMLVGFVVALFGIYAILALLFESYLQPAIVMLVIPLGFAGAILGHIVVGMPLMIFSLFGMVGLTGIVVNDALVLIDFINRRRRAGYGVIEAAAGAGRVRFRAVFLTTVTTVAGLLPLLLETSLTAQFLIPMALSIAAGVAAATVLTLFLVPCLFVIVEDVRAFYIEAVPTDAGAASAAAAVDGRVG